MAIRNESDYIYRHGVLIRLIERDERRMKRQQHQRLCRCGEGVNYTPREYECITLSHGDRLDIAACE